MGSLGSTSAGGAGNASLIEAGGWMCKTVSWVASGVVPLLAGEGSEEGGGSKLGEAKIPSLGGLRMMSGASPVLSHERERELLRGIAGC